jgi:uncharacterized protein YdbL (DUF1318 family)
MKRMTTTLAAVVVLGVCAVAVADEMAELRGRFQARDAAVSKLKAEGVLGETSVGLLEAPKEAEAGARKVMAEENADRRRLYQLIAERESATPEAVADRAARRNFARAKSGEWLKYPDGQWRQKP